MSGGGGGGVGGGVSIYVFYPSMPTKVTVQFNLFGGTMSGKGVANLIVSECECEWGWGWGWGGVFVCAFHPSMPTKMAVQFNLFDGEWLKQACPKILFI